jgi:hypothetical protein
MLIKTIEDRVIIPLHDDRLIFHPRQALHPPNSPSKPDVAHYNRDWNSSAEDFPPEEQAFDIIHSIYNVPRL